MKNLKTILVINFKQSCIIVIYETSAKNIFFLHETNNGLTSAIKHELNKTIECKKG